MKVVALLVALMAVSAAAAPLHLPPKFGPMPKFYGGVRGVRPITTQFVSQHKTIDGTGRHGYQFGDGNNPFVTGDFAEANTQNMADVIAEEQVERDIKMVAKGGANMAEPAPEGAGHTEPSSGEASASGSGAAEGKAAGSTEFTYVGKLGPFNWAEDNAAWKTCGSGKEQSPIDFDSKKGEFKPFDKVLNLEYPVGKVKSTKAINNGHSLQIDISPGAKLSLPNGGKQLDYELKQLHFHSGSEHTVNGKHFEFEMHLVHVSADGKIAVIGIFFHAEEGKEPSPFMSKFFSQFPAEVGEKDFSVALGLADLLNSIPNKSLWHYSGSLTTPPCTEGVQWFVMQHSLPASASQRDLFLKDIGANYRPTQPLNGREITELKDTSAGSSEDGSSSGSASASASAEGSAAAEAKA